MRYALALAVWLTAGCDSGGPDGLSDGRFTGSVSGARELSLSGQALFNVDPEFESWGLVLAAGPTRVVSALVLRAEPAAGAVRIPDTAFASLGEFSGGGGDSFEADSGLLTVTDVSDGIVRGTLAFGGESEISGARLSVEATVAASRLDAPEVPTARYAPRRATAERRNATAAQAASAAGTSASATSVGP